MSSLHEVRLGVNEFAIRGISPSLLQRGFQDPARPVVAIQPGWACRAEYQEEVLEEMHNSGIDAFATDTRKGVGDIRVHPRFSELVHTARSVLPKDGHILVEGEIVDAIEQYTLNRWEARRSIALQGLFNWLGLAGITQVGHSEGARMAVINARAHPRTTDHVILVNSSGLATKETPEDQTRWDSIVEYIKRLRTQSLDSSSSPSEIAHYVARALVYVASNPQRVIGDERAVMKHHNQWQDIDALLAQTNVKVTAFHAQNDRLVPFEPVAEAAVLRSEINFVPTVGSHGNMKSPEVVRGIVEAVYEGFETSQKTQ